ncbi:MAG: hypothetical protein K2Y28_00785 [Burkholderiaceae bacterium]|nr:hypothetical protein [Burkholderiaceae bacterium]
MDIQNQVETYLVTQPESKRKDMQALDRIILGLMPDCKLWFFDGKDEKGKIVCNPSIGYGFQILESANGKKKDYYQIGVSANTTGISLYLLGLKDKNYLAETYGKELGKASITSYCIKFKSLAQIRIDVLTLAMQYAIEQTSPSAL